MFAEQCFVCLFLSLECCNVFNSCFLQLCGGKPSEGIFVGVFLSMSSTAVVCVNSSRCNCFNSYVAAFTWYTWEVFSNDKSKVKNLILSMNFFIGSSCLDDLTSLFSKLACLGLCVCPHTTNKHWCTCKSCTGGEGMEIE